MSKPFDATSKDLIESDPAGWVAYLGRPAEPGRVSVIDADVSTVTADADKVIRVADDPPWVLHLEFQSGHEVGLPLRVLRYNSLLQYRHDCAAASVVFLLRPAANAAAITGEYRIAPPVGPAWTFRYQVVRVWEQPAGGFLSGGLALIPFAPLADVGPGLTDVVRRMRERLDREATRQDRAKLWAASYVLMGLRYDEAVIDQVLSGVLGMEESVTYQALVRKGLAEGLAQGMAQGMARGRKEEAIRVILRQGAKRFGLPSPGIESRLKQIDDIDRLEQLLDRILVAGDWDELLTAP